MITFYSVIRAIGIFIFKLIYPWEINGSDKLPEKGRYIICSNHISNMDPIFLIISQRRKIYFMAKSELFKNKIFSKFLSKMGAFPVQRKKGDTKAINRSFEILESNNVLGIFIEGTRSKNGEFLRPKSGVSVIAYKTNSPVIPVCITPKRGKNVRPFRKTIITYGDPISISDLSIEEGSGLEIRNASRFIMGKIKELREENS